VQQEQNQTSIQDMSFFEIMGLVNNATDNQMSIAYVITNCGTQMETLNITVLGECLTVLQDYNVLLEQFIAKHNATIEKYNYDPAYAPYLEPGEVPQDFPPVQPPFNPPAQPSFTQSGISFMQEAYATSELSNVPTIGDILNEEPPDEMFYPQCGDLVKFYRTLDEIIATKSLPADQQNYIEKMERGIVRTTACEEYFKGLKFEPMVI
jgi:hypothetical protein